MEVSPTPLLTDAMILAALKFEKFLINNKPICNREDPLIIHPILDERQIFGTKVELRLENEVFRFKQLQPLEFDLTKEIVLNHYAEKIIIPYGDPFVLHPGELMAGYTFESIRMPNNMMGRIEPRARLAKMGLSLLSGMGSVDPGFQNPLVLLFVNSGRFPMILRPLMRVISLSINLLRDRVKSSFRESRNLKAVRFDPDNIVLNDPERDFDARQIQNFSRILSNNKMELGSAKA